MGILLPVSFWAEQITTANLVDITKLLILTNNGQWSPFRLAGEGSAFGAHLFDSTSLFLNCILRLLFFLVVEGFTTALPVAGDLNRIKFSPSHFLCYNWTSSPHLTANVDGETPNEKTTISHWCTCFFLFFFFLNMFSIFLTNAASLRPSHVLCPPMRWRTSEGREETTCRWRYCFLAAKNPSFGELVFLLFGVLVFLVFVFLFFFFFSGVFGDVFLVWCIFW